MARKSTYARGEGGERKNSAENRPGTQTSRTAPTPLRNRNDAVGRIAHDEVAGFEYRPAAWIVANQAFHPKSSARAQ